MFSQPTLEQFADAMLQLWPDEEFADHFRHAFKLKETPRWIIQSIAARPTREMETGTYLLYDPHNDVIEISVKRKGKTRKIHIVRAIERNPEVSGVS